MLITKALLVENEACRDQIELFEKFLDGAESIEATPENVQRAYAFGLNVVWTFELLGLNFSGMLEDNGYQTWYQNGKLHRTDGPAIIYSDGTKYWYLNGKYHRTDGPAAIYPDGSEHWYQNGKRHREDGPAIINPNGYQAWYQNGKRHRIDGPAVVYPNGTKCYYLNGRLLTEEEYKLQTQNNSRP
jgi:hypothetical protein